LERDIPAWSRAEAPAILDACHRPAYADLPPEQVVLRLPDEGQRYLASVSTFYGGLCRRGAAPQYTPWSENSESMGYGYAGMKLICPHAHKSHAVVVDLCLCLTVD